MVKTFVMNILIVFLIRSPRCLGANAKRDTMETVRIVKFKKVEFTHNIRPICMFHTEINPYLRTAVALGWGNNDKDGLTKR